MSKTPNEIIEQLRTVFPKGLHVVVIHQDCCSQHPEGYFGRVALPGLTIVPRGYYLDRFNRVVEDWKLACKN